MSGPCVLIANSCTTGWFDWAHGELWICPDGLIRRPLGIGFTIRRSLRAGAAAELRSLLPRTEMDGATLVADPSATRIAWDDLAAATLKRGIVDHSLHMTLADGRKVKYLWAAGQHDFEALGASLVAALGERVRIHRAPIG